MSGEATAGHLFVLRHVLEQRGHVQQSGHRGGQVLLVARLRVQVAGGQRQASPQQPLAVLQVHADFRQLVQKLSQVCLVVHAQYLIRIHLPRALKSGKKGCAGLSSLKFHRLQVIPAQGLEFSRVQPVFYKLIHRYRNYLWALPSLVPTKIGIFGLY